MNYVFEQRLCRARAAESAGGRDAGRCRSAPRRTGSPAPTRSACRSRASSRSICRSAAGRRTAPQFDAWRQQLAAAACDARPFRTRRRQAARRDSAAGERRGSTKPYVFPIDRRRRRLRRAADVPPVGDCADRRTASEGAGPATSPACSRSGTAGGWNSSASRRRSRRRQPIGEARLERDAVGGARSDRRRHPAQPDAVRLPDPGAEGVALSRAAEGARAGADRCARLYCRARGRHRRARRGAARDPRGRARGRLGVPAAGPADDHAAAAARGGDHRQPPRPVRAAGARRRVQPAGSFGTGALAAFVATPCAGPFLGAALGTALLLPRPARSPCSPRSALVSRFRSCWSLSFRRFASRLPKPGRWMDRLKRFLAIPMGLSAAAACGCSTAGWGAGACSFGLFAALRSPLPLFAGRIQRAGRGARPSCALLSLHHRGCRRRA